MKILIVDDEAKRYPRLIDALAQIEIPRENIDIVPSARDARDRLATTAYDLLILDILIPLNPEGESDSQNALDLLLEIHESETDARPRQIVGITSDLSVAGQVASQFEEWTWSVLDYSESNDEWITRATNCARYILSEIKSEAVRPAEFQTDLAVVCALPSPELSEVLALPWNWEAARPIDDCVFVHDGHFEVEGRTVTVAATAAPRMGMVSTALLTATMINKLRPRLLAMCGICAGVQGKVRMGDVLLSEPAWDFQSGKRVSEQGNSQFAASPHQLYTPAIVRTHVEQIRADSTAMAGIASKFGENAPGISKIVIGPVATGSAVLADGAIIEEIKAQHRDLIGVEMEAYGLYAAAVASSHPQPLHFSLKSVCDFANSKKDDQHQRYAAFASANVLKLLMDKHGPRLLERAGA